MRFSLFVSLCARRGGSVRVEASIVTTSKVV
jgi:hypothetical protein